VIPGLPLVYTDSKISITIDIDLYRQLRVYCDDAAESPDKAIEELLKCFLEKHRLWPLKKREDG